VFSPDGNFLLAYYSSSSGRVWNLQLGEIVLTVPLGAGSTQYGRRAFSADNRYFAISVGEGLIRIFDLPAGKERLQVKLGSQQARMAFHPRQPTLAVYVWDSEQTIRLLDASTGQIQKDGKRP
jgi:WD40 repeat protein